MSSINSVRKLQILYFRKKNEKIKNLKNGEKKGPEIGIYTYYLHGPLKDILSSSIFSGVKSSAFFHKNPCVGSFWIIVHP